MTQASATTIDDLRAAQRQLRDGPAMPRLWHMLCNEWQRVVDRGVAHSAPWLDQGICRDDAWTTRGQR